MDNRPDVKLHTTSYYFLEGLNEIGVDYLFCNLGTDHAPLIEEMARWQRAGREFPRTILCPHENTAMHMAAGVAAITGRGQAVLVHVDAGTANCVLGAHNIRRARTPLLLMAGRAPYSVRGELPGGRDNYVHFVQEPFDQASLVRPYVKWEWTLPSGIVAKEVLRRAHSVAHSDPKGPVYLMLPRETLAEEWDESAVRAFPADRYGATAAAAASAESIGALAERILAARKPTLFVSYAGRNLQAPALLQALAEFAGIGVVDAHPIYLNIAQDSACFLGSTPGDHVAEADVGILLDTDVPWIPRYAKENPATWWAHIDVDTVKEDFPMWGFASNLRVQGDSALILAQLLETLKAKATPAFRQSAAQRVQALAAGGQARRTRLAQAAAERGQPGAVNPAYLCSEIAKALGPDDIVVNEAVRNSPIVLNHVPRTRPGSYIGFAGGGLGGAGGLALGAKLAKPSATVVQLIGDGGFYFNNPSSTYAVAKQYGLPILTVVFDNGGWSAVKEATLRMYASGEAFESQQFQARLAPEVQFADVVRSAGGHGETVSEPEAIPAAVERSFAAVKSGKAVLLHVKVPSI
jgi:acetolactate synthase-1/2/3 large subunit